MSEEVDAIRPIIIKRVKKNAAHGHHGSWKVAFADFATAMMAFFLLLWLMGNTDKAQKTAISGYFNDPRGLNSAGASESIIGDGGANKAVIEMQAVMPQEVEVEKPLTDDELTRLAEQKELERLELLKQKVESLMSTSGELKAYQEQVMIDITSAGLRIQIVDKDKRPMFDSGSALPKDYSSQILFSLAEVLKRVPNKLSITGHTDATPYIEREEYGNWELSTDRANAARRELLKGGIEEEKIARVEGFASSILFDQARPFNPINRRIAIIVLKQSAAEEIEKQVLGL